MPAQVILQEMNKHRLNIVLSKTSTKIGGMIRTVIGGDYNHCSFYIDDEIDSVYGFSRKYRNYGIQDGCL